MSDKRYSQLILAESKDVQVSAVIGAINDLTAAKQATVASVMVGCAGLLGQCIAMADPTIAPEMRAAIADLIDGFAMQSVVKASVF